MNRSSLRIVPLHKQGRVLGIIMTLMKIVVLFQGLRFLAREDGWPNIQCLQRISNLKPLGRDDASVIMGIVIEFILQKTSLLELFLTVFAFVRFESFDIVGLAAVAAFTVDATFEAAADFFEAGWNVSAGYLRVDLKVISHGCHGFKFLLC